MKLSYFLSIMLIAALFFGFRSLNNSTINDSTLLSPRTDDDTLWVHQVYSYRTISVGLDSLTLGCMYGEMFLVDDDSLRIEYNPWYGSNGLDTTDIGINLIAKTASFYTKNTSTLTFWRGLMVSYLYPTLPTMITDTCSWMLEVRQTSSGRLLGVLDSAGFLPGQTDSSVFPTAFGTINSVGKSFDVMSATMDNFISSQGDSVYIVMKINSHGSGTVDCHMDDVNVINGKLSIWPEFQQEQQPTTNATKVSLPNSTSMEIFPNPVGDMARILLKTPESRTMNVELRNVNGAVIRNFKVDCRSNVVQILPIDCRAIPSGTYSIIGTDGSGNILTSKNLVITH